MYCMHVFACNINRQIFQISCQFSTCVCVSMCMCVCVVHAFYSDDVMLYNEREGEGERERGGDIVQYMF